MSVNSVELTLLILSLNLLEKHSEVWWLWNLIFYWCKWKSTSKVLMSVNIVELTLLVMQLKTYKKSSQKCDDCGTQILIDAI